MTDADRVGVAALACEMQAHYAGAALPAAAVESLIGTLPPGCEVLVATSPHDVAGAAFFGTLFPGTRLAPILFLKDLYVRAAARRLGAGEALMRRLAALAVERGCSRIDWEAEAANAPARALYDRLGAEAQPKIAYRWHAPALAAAAAPTP
ncbi:MAG: GNAT family N-acetyltransferase [Methylobacteriaceae bacterium]|nr:GNAT family N-acetyltransferase [Methylobacteriaceae bacterium]